MDPIGVERHGPVTVITFQRPDVGNSLDAALVAGFGTALEEAEADDAVQAIVLTGAGDRFFCTGLDLKAFASGEGLASESAQGFQRFMRERFAKPVVAAANGHAVAGGFEILLRCDLVVAAEHAEFGLPEAARGLVAAAGITALSRRVPPAIVLELGLTAQRISAERAAQLGIVNRVVPSGAALDGALELAGAIAANSPLSLRLTKELAWSAEDAVSDESWAKVRAVMATAMGSEDAKEGARAFVEKRPPVWTGR